MEYERKFNDGRRIGFLSGKFDNWQVNVIDSRGVKYAPLDIDYFNELILLSDLIGVEETYKIFTDLYEKTDKNVDSAVLQFISDVASELISLKFDAEMLLTTLYYTMVAEENRKNTKLGKRIKRLGVHQILKEGLSIRRAANYSRGMQWREIDSLCRERGF